MCVCVFPPSEKEIYKACGLSHVCVCVFMGEESIKLGGSLSGYGTESAFEKKKGVRNGNGLKD